MPHTGVASIRFPDQRGAGVMSRHRCTQLPSTLAPRKVRAINALLDSNQMPREPMATAIAVRQFNELQSQLLTIYELKQGMSQQLNEARLLNEQLAKLGGKLHAFTESERRRFFDEMAALSLYLDNPPRGSMHRALDITGPQFALVIPNVFLRG